MSYEVRYHADLCKHMEKLKARKKSGTYIKWIFLTALLTMFFSIPGKDFWMNCLIPGDTPLTTAAVETFAENMSEGTPFNKAFQEFCLEIMKCE